jgi:hypothetical protein
MVYDISCLIERDDPRQGSIDLCENELKVPVPHVIDEVFED